MENKKPGWTYGHSDALDLDFAFRKDKSGNVELYTEDKTHYTFKEIAVINKHGSITPEVHLIKKIMQGEIIS